MRDSLACFRSGETRRLNSRRRGQRWTRDDGVVGGPERVLSVVQMCTRGVVSTTLLDSDVALKPGTVLRLHDAHRCR